MSKTTELKVVRELFDLKAHMGHKKSRVHPKAKKNIYQFVNGTSVIDLTITSKQIEEAKEYMIQQAKAGKVLLAVGTKRSAAKSVQEHAKKHRIAYISNKWLPGLLTNFKTIMENVKRIKELREAKENGTWEELPKHEQVEQQRILSKLNRLYEGVESLERHPDIMFIVDIKKEKNALKEARMFDIPVVAVVDTNASPDQVAVPIIANDDSAEVVDYLVKEVLEAYASGRKKNS